MEPPAKSPTPTVPDARTATAGRRDPDPRPVVVLGATGYTGGFVLTELARKGHRAVLAGRDAAALAARASGHPGAEVRIAAVGDAASLDRALDGAAAVVNCAGPFLDTALPVVDAALRSGAHYLDVSAEQAAILAVFESFASRARYAGITVLPAMGFYGGLGDLLATAAMDADWPDADEIRIGIALDSWRPTRGTRLTVRRNAGRQMAFTRGRLEPAPAERPRGRWTFPPPVGTQEVVPLYLADAVTLSRHLRMAEIRAFMNEAPIRDLHDPETPPPVPLDESGRSAQTFLLDVVARRGSSERRITAAGRDIYATSASMIAEAVTRILDGRATLRGVSPAGALFDARDFLAALIPDPLSVTWPAAHH
jgi:NAD(P)-dependent dehydrogenase (short-subunit alcohol dehydrogenase family)